MNLQVTNRARAAIAAVIAVAFTVGGVFFVHTSAGDRPAAVVLAETALVTPWESRQLHAYFDRLAAPPIWTVCDGDTKDVTPGMIQTAAQCDERLDRRMMTEFYPAMKACVPEFEHRPISWQAMMLSLSWNVGWHVACGSTAARLGAAGRYLESCKAATAWNKAGGHVIVGLVNRRENGDAKRIGEGELCVTGVTS